MTSLSSLLPLNSQEEYGILNVMLGITLLANSLCLMIVQVWQLTQQPLVTWHLDKLHKPSMNGLIGQQSKQLILPGTLISTIVMIQVNGKNMLGSKQMQIHLHLHTTTQILLLSTLLTPQI